MMLVRRSGCATRTSMSDCAANGDQHECSETPPRSATRLESVHVQTRWRVSGLGRLAPTQTSKRSGTARPSCVKPSRRSKGRRRSVANVGEAPICTSDWYTSSNASGAKWATSSVLLTGLCRNTCATVSARATRPPHLDHARVQELLGARAGLLLRLIAAARHARENSSLGLAHFEQRNAQAELDDVLLDGAPGLFLFHGKRRDRCRHAGAIAFVGCGKRPPYGTHAHARRTRVHLAAVSAWRLAWRLSLVQ